GQQHDRLRAALPREREVALDAPDVVVRVEAADDEDDVDVGSDDLRLRLAALGGRALANERAPPREDGRDRRAILVLPSGDRDPVADRGMLVGVPQPAGDLRATLAVLRVDDVLASVLDRRPRGDETVLLVREERLGERVVPAQGLKIQRLCLLKESVPE